MAVIIICMYVIMSELKPRIQFVTDERSHFARDGNAWSSYLIQSDMGGIGIRRRKISLTPVQVGSVPIGYVNFLCRVISRRNICEMSGWSSALPGTLSSL